jgi:hypothetical protein
MNKLFNAAVLLIIPGGMLFAQQKDGTAVSSTGSTAVAMPTYTSADSAKLLAAKTETQKMGKYLDLTSDQIEKIQTINFSYEKKIVSANGFPDGQADGKQAQKHWDIWRTDQLRRVLNADQMSMYEKENPEKVK